MWHQWISFDFCCVFGHDQCQCAREHTSHRLTNVLCGRMGIFTNANIHTPVRPQCDNGTLNLAGWSVFTSFRLILLTLYTKQFAVDTNKIGNLSCFSISNHQGCRSFLFHFVPLLFRQNTIEISSWNPTNFSLDNLSLIRILRQNSKDINQ